MKILMADGTDFIDYLKDNGIDNERLMGDWMNGISPEMWAEECRVNQAEDDAMVLRSASSDHSENVPQKQMTLELA